MFGLEPNESLLHEVVKAEAAARRQGTHATKTRGLVAGGRAKPYRQKGTGRARQGTTRAAAVRGRRRGLRAAARGYTRQGEPQGRTRKARAIALSLHAARLARRLRRGAFAAPRTKDASRCSADWREDRPLVVVIGEAEDAAASRSATCRSASC